MTEHDVARNATALRNLAARLESWGLSDPERRAEHIAMNLAADGYQKLEPIPPARGPGGSDHARHEALAATAVAVKTARDRRMGAST